MKDEEIILETKFIGDIKGIFSIPSYQRGYRWEKSEVTRLLDDIFSIKEDSSYCLQPIVVRKNDDKYDLIDGQQRLTTIYLIYCYMHNLGFADKPSFTLLYEIRGKSEEFLQSIDISRKEENIDFWFICEAYECIKCWFEQKDTENTLREMKNYLAEKVRVIWYEVGQSEDAISLFTRLNIGKIPLTSSELVKAMFLSQNKESITKEKQEEIALQWDNIEKELHNDSLWYFLTNKENMEYQTRIDLVLDLISQKGKNDREKYYTFFKFDEMSRDKSLNDIWREIQKTFLVLKDWYENHEFYHKIGYLIISEALTLQDIYVISQNKTKNEFMNVLDVEIKKSVSISDNYSELSYAKSSDQEKIKRLLLLFNVETMRQHKEQKFPFDKFKFGKDENGHRVVWSLEHIHAQHSEGMRTQEMWKEWLGSHIASVKAVSENPTELIEKMNAAISKEKLDSNEFGEIQKRVISLLSEGENTEYLHSIANMALLNSSDNAALNNSTFDVKRTKIIKMDKNGQYIPFCTRMVFLKYYTPTEDNQIHFWGHQDRVAYIEEINKVLKDYIEPIILEKEEN